MKVQQRSESNVTTPSSLPMMSKTQHYRKVTKPLLERKRRARMNHYLDELKDIIIETMESQGEHITKLEKADILELTVSYLKSKSKQSNSNQILSLSLLPDAKISLNVDKFHDGYTQAAYEVSKIFSTIPGIDVNFGTKMMKHLGYKLKDFKSSNNSIKQINVSPKLQKLPIIINNNNYHEYVKQISPQPQQNVNEVWRPW